jgi:hypothetical protein
MTASVVYPEIDRDLPFTLSSKGIDFLKKELDEDYLIISDDLSTPALKKEFALDESVLLAKKAGVDILLVAGWNQPKDSFEAFSVIMNAVEKKDISEKNIDESVLKILKLKKESFLNTEIFTEEISEKKDQLEEDIVNEVPEEIVVVVKDIVIEKEEVVLEKKEIIPVTLKEEALEINNNLVNWGYTVSQGRNIDTVIIHSSYDALGDNPYSFNGVLDLYKTYKVSPHYVIDRDGVIHQLVKEKDIAWHAGYSKVPDGRTGANDFSIGIEIINTKTVGPNNSQYEALSKLIKSIKSRYSIKYILGHSDIAPERKTDPWMFSWDKLDI